MIKKNTILKTAFDEYKILEQIGEGGNGTVYKAIDSDGLDVAIKVLPKNISREKLKRFRNEINFCRKYSNENIIEVKDNGFYTEKEKEYIYYVMPLYECSLRKKMKNGMSIEQMIKAFWDICNGLKFAHSKGCIHRDLKPENILIDKKGKYVIADFGIAHFEDNDKITQVETKETSRLANFSYHSPEQLDGETYPASDIFALGLILNEMFTGKVPAGDNYKKISEINEDYAFLDKLVQKMLSQNPEDRYQNIEELNIDYEAQKRNFKNLKKITILSQPLVKSEARDYLTDKPISITDIKVKDNVLNITLSNTPNYDWINFYNKALGSYTSSPYCYTNFKFWNNNAKYNIEDLVNYSNVKELISRLISEFKQAISCANKNYAKHVVYAYNKKQEEEIKRRQIEINKLKNENNLNDFIKGLI